MAKEQIVSHYINFKWKSYKFPLRKNNPTAVTLHLTDADYVKQ